MKDLVGRLKEIENSEEVQKGIYRLIKDRDLSRGKFGSSEAHKYVNNHGRGKSKSHGYLKENTIDALITFTDSYSLGSFVPRKTGRNVDNRIYRKINNEELKKIWYGVLDINCDPERKLKPVVNKLREIFKDELPVLMLYAGFHFMKNQEIKELDGKSLTETVCTIIDAGYEGILEKHNKKYENGEYARPLKLPGSDIFKKYKGGQMSFFE